MDVDFKKDEELEQLLKELNNLKQNDYEFHDNLKPVYSTGKGLTRETVEEISEIKKEPDWMRRARLKALEVFQSKPVPTWGPDLSGIDWENTSYYNRPDERRVNDWNEVPDQIKETFQKLGIPEIEQKYLAGSVAQYDSEGVYHNLKKVWEDKGVVFMDLDSAIQRYPDLVKDYYCKAVPITDNKFAALNGAVWSGGSFLYVPKGVQIDMPLQTYFRMNGEATGQFEHTIVVADEGSKVHYVEGCLPADEIVSRGDTFTPISTVNLLDSVMTHSGRKSQVTRTFIHPYEGRMLTVTPLSMGNAFRLTVEHPVLAVRRSDVDACAPRNGKMKRLSDGRLPACKPDFIRADELKEGDFIVYVAPTETTDDPSINEPVLRLIGLYAAAGSLHTDQASGIREVSFRYGRPGIAKTLDMETANLIEFLGGEAIIARLDNGLTTVSSKSGDLISLLNDLVREVGNGKKFSERIMLLPPQKQKLIIDQYHGAVSAFKGRDRSLPSVVRFSAAGETMAFQLQEMLARIGTFATITPGRVKNRAIHDTDGGSKAQYVVQYRENRQFSEVRRSGNIFFVPIKNITSEDYNDLVYNLEVSGENTYLAKGFAVHNCTAPRYDRDSLHSAIVEIYVKKNARARYTSVQNWSKSVYNMPTKRSWVDENAQMEWVGGSLGSKVTMLYPSSYLRGAHSSASNLNIALAGAGTYKDTGAKALHFAPYTSSRIVAKSISIEDGKAIYRGLLRMNKGAVHSKSKVQCDALLINDQSSSLTFPHDEIYEPTATFSHEASVGKIGTEELTYLRSRGLSEDEASSMIVLGFLDDVMKEIPMEFAVEMNRLIKLEMSKFGAVG